VALDVGPPVHVLGAEETGDRPTVLLEDVQIDEQGRSGNFLDSETQRRVRLSHARPLVWLIGSCIVISSLTDFLVSLLSSSPVSAHVSTRPARPDTMGSVPRDHSPFTITRWIPCGVRPGSSS